MPRLDLTITKAYWHTSEGPGRIHFTVETGQPERPVRRLYADEGTGLHGVLKAALDEKGYTGPQGDSEG